MSPSSPIVLASGPSPVAATRSPWNYINPTDNPSFVMCGLADATHSHRTRRLKHWPRWRLRCVLTLAEASPTELAAKIRNSREAFKRLTLALADRALRTFAASHRSARLHQATGSNRRGSSGVAEQSARPTGLSIERASLSWTKPPGRNRVASPSKPADSPAASPATSNRGDTRTVGVRCSKRLGAGSPSRRPPSLRHPP